MVFLGPRPRQRLQTKRQRSRGSPVAAAGFYITVSCTGISDNYFFFYDVFSFLSEHSMFSDLHFPALIICSADQFSCLEVEQDM